MISRYAFTGFLTGLLSNVLHNGLYSTSLMVGVFFFQLFLSALLLSLKQHLFIKLKSACTYQNLTGNAVKDANSEMNKMFIYDRMNNAKCQMTSHTNPHAYLKEQRMKLLVLWSGLCCYTEGWGGKCSEILVAIKLLYNLRVNKAFTHNP